MKKLLLVSLGLFLISGIMLFHTAKKLEAKIYSTISGRVVAEDTGKGVKGAIVRLYPYDEKRGHPWEPGSKETDEEGWFLFKNLQPGKYFLTVDPPPSYYGDNGYIGLLQYNKLDTIILEKGEVVYNLVKVVRVGGSISGRIMKKDGTGHAGATVFVDSGACSKFVETASDGSYKVEGLMPSEDYEVRAHIIKERRSLFYYHELSKIKKKIKVEVGKETKSIDLIIDFESPTGIEGTVTSPDGKPLEGAIIWAHIIESNDTVVKGRTYTDEEGRYSLKGLCPGSGSIYASFPRTEAEEFQKIHLREGEMLKINIVLNISIKKEGKQAVNFFSEWEKSQNNYKFTILNRSLEEYPSLGTVDLKKGCEDFSAKIQARIIDDVLSAYVDALDLIKKNCSKGGIWTKPEIGTCLCDYGRKAVKTIVKINVFCTDTCAGITDSENRIIWLLGIPALCGCIYTNIMSHELLHIGGVPGDEGDLFAEACSNLGFDEKCQSHTYGSTEKDCDCCKLQGNKK